MNSTPTRSGRGLLWSGLVIAAAGIAAYIVQVAMAQLKMPWYLPFTGTIAFLLVARAMLHQRGAGRWIALGMMLLIAGAEWAFMFGVGVPDYVGPVAVGKVFPKFAALKADGSPFTDADLRGDRDNVMVFFRGRW